MSYFTLYPMVSLSLWNLSLLALHQRDFCCLQIVKSEFRCDFSAFMDAMEITMIFYVLCFHSWHSLMPVKKWINIWQSPPHGDTLVYTSLHSTINPISVNLLFKLGLRLTRTLLSLFFSHLAVNPIHHGNSHRPNIPPLDPGSKSQSESIREKWWQVW